MGYTHAHTMLPLAYLPVRPHIHCTSVTTWKYSLTQTTAESSADSRSVAPTNAHAHVVNVSMRYVHEKMMQRQKCNDVTLNDFLAFGRARCGGLLAPQRRRCSFTFGVDLPHQLTWTIALQQP